MSLSVTSGSKAQIPLSVWVRARQQFLSKADKRVYENSQQAIHVLSSTSEIVITQSIYYKLEELVHLIIVPYLPHLTSIPAYPDPPKYEQLISPWDFAYFSLKTNERVEDAICFYGSPTEQVASSRQSSVRPKPLCTQAEARKSI